jgi:hypothetical protein
LVSARIFFRFLLPAVLALPLGFVGLALAAENEPMIAAPVLMLFSPGLKVAELVTPERREALGVTFGWFLRVGIAVNGAYYFALFLLLVYLLKRRRSSASPG